MCCFPQGRYFPQGRHSRCNLYSVTTGNWLEAASVFVFFWGGTMRTMVQHVYVRQRKVQHYINIVIEYGRFRLKIIGIIDIKISQCESSSCIELYCSQLSMFSKS